MQLNLLVLQLSQLSAQATKCHSSVTVKTILEVTRLFTQWVIRTYFSSHAGSRVCKAALPMQAIHLFPYFSISNFLFPFNIHVYTTSRRDMLTPCKLVDGNWDSKLIGVSVSGPLHRWCQRLCPTYVLLLQSRAKLLDINFICWAGWLLSVWEKHGETLPMRLTMDMSSCLLPHTNFSLICLAICYDPVSETV